VAALTELDGKTGGSLARIVAARPITGIVTTRIVVG